MSVEQASGHEPVELGFIESLENMISVQEGSTVSRTVMQREGGNVVLFSFAPERNSASIPPPCLFSCRRWRAVSR